MTIEQILTDAESLIEDLSEQSLMDSYTRLEKERHGYGCGCLTCKRLACKEMNEIADFISFGADPVYWEVTNGEIVSKMNRTRFDRIKK